MKSFFSRAGPALVALALSAASASTQIPATHLFVCVQDEAKVAVIDMATRKLVRMVDLKALGFSANAKPHHIAVEPDGSFWYVSLIGDNRVLRLDPGDRVVTQRQMETPGLLAIDPTKRRLLVSRSMSAVNPPKRVAIVDRDGLEGEEIDIFFPRPHPAVVSRQGIAYTGSLGVNQLAAIDLETQQVELLDVPGASLSLVQFAISPDGKTLVASAELTGELLVFDLANPRKPSLSRRLPVGPMAFDPTYTPDGRFVLVPVKGNNSVAIVDVTSWIVVARIEHPSLRQPHAIAISPDGKTAFVSNNNTADHMADHAAHGGKKDAAGVGAVTIIDLVGRRAAGAIDIGKNLTGIGLRGSH